ncbi:MAG: EAL domain-containing protein [Rhodanobacteraceae bacterium]|nr:EAL domain-containing protein [Rhodanobacteraceae bacterium]
MDRVLLIEASATRRRALSTMLAQKGYEVAIIATYAEGLSTLSSIEREAYAALVVSWPEYSDHRADDVFALLRARDWIALPVLVMADSTDAGAVNWLMKRPSTALLLWSDYSDAPDALNKLIHPIQRAPATDDRSDSSQLRVLFVDDSPTVRIAFKRLLAAEGYQVDTAVCAEDGLVKAQAKDYDIAIVDYFMPGDNGAMLVKKLRDAPETASILAAIITGTYSDRVITESLGAGAVECMFKSEARELFLARMRSLSRTVLDRKAIDNERRRLQGILTSVGEGVYGVNSRGVIQFINPAALDILGYSHDVDFVGEMAADRFHYAFEDKTRIPRQACFLSQCYENGNQVSGWQTVFWHESGRSVPVECTVYPLDIDGKREGAVVAFRDVSQRRLLEEELRWQASHDALTKLHNRAHFEQQLQQEVARLRRSDQTSLLLFVDVDRFKYINDTLGHAAGDQLLVEASHRLRNRLRVNDTLARMGGDEYALILRNSHQDPELVADEFRKALSGQLFSYGDKHYRLSASIGVAVLDRHVMSPSEAMANADIACHIAKNHGRNQVHVYSYDTDQRASMDVELNWSARLEEAIRDDLFVLCFQPILPLPSVDLKDLPDAEGELWMRHFQGPRPRRIYYEVLLRMRGPSGELVAPNAFLPTAERYNMMLDIDRWVIHNALKALRDSHAVDPEHLVGLSINLSAQSLGANGIGRFVMDKLVEFNVDPSLVTFEITETKAVTNLDAARELIQQLRGLGCRFALDDFGCGFSSFTHLKHLDVDFLKIDGAFIQGLLEDPVDRAVIAAINDIAHSVGKRTVAEYVDRPQVLSALLACGVDFIQGYYVGRPTSDLRTGYLRARSSKRAPALPPLAAAG